MHRNVVFLFLALSVSSCGKLGALLCARDVLQSKAPGRPLQMQYAGLDRPRVLPSRARLKLQKGKDLLMLLALCRLLYVHGLKRRAAG